MIGSAAVDLGLDSGALDTTMVVGGLVQSLLLNYCGDIDETRFRFAGEYYTDGESLLVELNYAAASPKWTAAKASRRRHFRQLYDEEHLLQAHYRRQAAV